MFCSYEFEGDLIRDGEQQVAMGIENRFLFGTGSVCSDSMASFGSLLNDSLIDSRQHDLRHVSYASYAYGIH